MNKRLIYILIGLATLVVLTIFVMNIGEKTQETARLTKCKQSIEQNANLRFGAADFSSNIVCPTKELTIDSKNPVEIKYKLADEMVECWDIFKQGKKEFFTGNGVFCTICTRADFKDKNIKIKGFPEFLMNTKIPRYDKTYFEYLASFSTSEAEKVIGEFEKNNYKADEDFFPTNKEYAVLFVQAKGKDSLEKLGKFLTAQNTAGKIGMTALGVGAAGAGLAVLGLVSNPVGWGIAVVGGVIAAISYIINPNNAPEYVSLTIFTEYTDEKLDEIGCEYLPVAQSE
jgi:hypothetical protein